MAQPPDLKIPFPSESVKVQIIDTTSRVFGIDLTAYFTPMIPGYTKIDYPAYAFLITHPSGRKALFDLGVRKDLENLSPRIIEAMKAGNWQITVQEDPTNPACPILDSDFAGRGLREIAFSPEGRPQGRQLRRRRVLQQRELLSRRHAWPRR